MLCIKLIIKLDKKTNRSQFRLSRTQSNRHKPPSMRTSGHFSYLLRLQLHGAIYRPDSFVLMSHHCANLKAIRYESTSLNRIVAGKSHSVIVA